MAQLVDWRHQPGAPLFAAGQWGPSSEQRNWDGGWAIVKISAQTWPPSLKNHRKGEKWSQTPLSLGSQEDQQNSLGWFKVSRRLSFPPAPSETIKHGAVKGPESDPKTQRRITWLIPTTEILGQISHCYSREFACYCLFVLLFFIISTSFILLVFCIFVLFSFLHLICLFNCIVWLVFLVLSFIVYF